MEWDTIFRIGEHTDMHGRTKEYTKEDLVKMAASPAGAPIFIHHPEDKNNAIKFGEVSELRVHQDLLQAKYKNIPAGFAAAVTAGLKLNKSVAFDPDTFVLDHVGLLGAGEYPAVEGLGPVMFSKTDKDKEKTTALYIFSVSEKGGTVDDDVPKDKLPTQKKESDEMDEKEVLKLQADVAEANKQLQAEQDEHKKTQAEFAKYRAEQEENALHTRITALAESGRIAPADKEKTMAFARALADGEATMKFSVGDKIETLSPREAYLRDLEAQPANKNGLLSEFAAKGSVGKDDAGAGFDFGKINDYA